MNRWLLLAVFGALGTISRACVGAWVQRIAGAGFPWGTAIVNLLGTFLFGLLWSASEGSSRSVDVRFVALTGFMGAFTTFSTLMFDIEQLAEASRFPAAAGNLALQCGLGLGCVVAGLAVGRAF